MTPPRVTVRGAEDPLCCAHALLMPRAQTPAATHSSSVQRSAFCKPHQPPFLHHSSLAPASLHQRQTLVHHQKPFRDANFWRHLGVWVRGGGGGG